MPYPLSFCGGHARVSQPQRETETRRPSLPVRTLTGQRQSFCPTKAFFLRGQPCLQALWRSPQLCFTSHIGCSGRGGPTRHHATTWRRLGSGSDGPALSRASGVMMCKIAMCFTKCDESIRIVSGGLSCYRCLPRPANQSDSK